MKADQSNRALPLRKLQLQRDSLTRLSNAALDQVVGGGPTKTSRCTTRDGCTQDILCLFTVGCGR